jgi:tannase
MFLDLLDQTNIDTLDGVTYDTLVSWIWQGWQMYQDTLQTNWPDLTPWYKSGAKVIHFHGESDFSIPTASSVYWYESVRQIMYPSMAYNDSIETLGDWYRLYLIPGAGHCAVNPLQPNGPFPQTNLAVMIDWVEKGVKPVTLNATVLQGDYDGQNQQLCAWPLRPLWADNGTVQNCVYDQSSIDTWSYDFTAFKLPVY